MAEAMEGANRAQGEVIFSQDNVVTFVPGPLKEEICFSGKLFVVKEPHDLVVEWRPHHQVHSDAKKTPDAENTDFKDFTVVNYKPKQSSDNESVEIRKTAKLPNTVTFEVSDLKSFRRTDVKVRRGVNKVVASFYLKDGSNILPFQFENAADFMSFICLLEEHVPMKRSQKDSSLYLINDPDTVAMNKSFNELEIFNDTPTSPFAVFKDPYILVDRFAKVTNFINEYVLYPNSNGASSDYEEEKVAQAFNESLSRIHIDHHEESGYELITYFQMPQRVDKKREDPVSCEEWNTYVDSEGRITNPQQLNCRIFRGGLSHALRSEAWKYLLHFYSYEDTYKQREVKIRQKIDDYYRMKLQWKTINADQESRFMALRDRRNLIEKDVSRTDRTHPHFEGDQNTNVKMLHDILMTYCMYNFDLGYVQGMSDLLSPILVVMQNEADAFWCFANWMEDIGANFEMEQLGMKAQLQNLSRLLHFVDSQFSAYLDNHESGNFYFVFRWLLILFKRDFKFQDVMRIWEVLWTGLPCKNFHLLICLAIFDTEKSTIMENNYGLSEILKHINDMAYKLNMEETLCKAEAIFHQIANCSQVPDVIQSILGLELPSATKTDSNENKDKTNEKKSPTTTSHSKCKDSEVDLEKVCDYAMWHLM